VALATPEGCWHVAKCDPGAALADGTPNYLGAAALSLAYDSWDSRGGAQVRLQYAALLTLHYITLHYITLHFITLHYITLHYTSLHYITLHYTTCSTSTGLRP
jgi:hypothetical protein